MSASTPFSLSPDQEHLAHRRVKARLSWYTHASISTPVSSAA